MKTNISLETLALEAVMALALVEDVMALALVEDDRMHGSKEEDIGY